MDIVIRRSLARGIPFLELGATNGGGEKPAVILYHGYTGAKELLLPHAYHYACAGLRVALPDAWGHGERADGEGAPSVTEAIFRTADEVGFVVDALAAPVTGLGGISMGGCITLCWLASGGRGVRAAAAMIASPDLVSVLDSPPGREHLGSPLTAGMREDLARRQPAANPGGAAGVPLLLLNGERDELMPLEPIRRYARDREAASPGVEVRLSVYPGVGHDDNVPMNREMLDWLRLRLGQRG